ncbi:YopX family protein [Streptococcus suis]
MVVPKFRAFYEGKMYGVKAVIWTSRGLYVTLDEGNKAGRRVRGAKLMQSTGMFCTFAQDELFEDDVIFWTYFDEFEDSGKARIVYRDGCWKLLDIKTGKEVWDSLFDCLENCTVFLSGNIYENPELVEVLND